jgi:hypothetical protein
MCGSCGGTTRARTESSIGAETSSWPDWESLEVPALRFEAGAASFLSSGGAESSRVKPGERTVSKQHPDNGPSFSKATTKPPRLPVPSLERKQALLDEAAREAAKEKEFRVDPAGWVGKHIVEKKK